MATTIRQIAMLFWLFLLPMVALSALAPSPNGPYLLDALTTNDRILIITRTNPITGEAWYYDGKAWVKGIDNPDIPRSQYHFKAVRYEIKGWSLIRMDTVTGKTWTLEGKRWKMVME